MQRREFIAGIESTAAWPVAVRARQSERMRQIGILMGSRESDPGGQARIESLLQGLRNLGWAEGRNIGIDYRWSADDSDRAQNSAAELVIMRQDLIVASPISTAEVVQRLITGCGRSGLGV